MSFVPSFSLGSTVSNADIIAEFKCANMGGMRRSNATNTLVIVSDHTKGLYEDKWFGDILHYTGMGKSSDVDVLQHALASKTFVQPLRNFVKHYGVSKRDIPNKNIVVFDEAQRAWDIDHVKEKHGITASEPDLIIRIADRIPTWCVFIGLMGEGQEIHNGEESGISQWVEALRKSNHHWRVVCPDKIASLFQDVADVTIADELDLTTSLRSHLAVNVTQWTNMALNGNVGAAQEMSQEIAMQGFPMYFKKDLDKAKRYCRNRYVGNSYKRYGLLASSKANTLQKYGVDNSYDKTKQIQVGPWFNDAPQSHLSCCQLTTVATEFACQGLELDMPIVCWGEDMVWGRRCLEAIPAKWLEGQRCESTLKE